MCNQMHKADSSKKEQNMQKKKFLAKYSRIRKSVAKRIAKANAVALPAISSRQVRLAEEARRAEGNR